MASEDFTYAPIDISSKDIRLLRLSDRYTPGPPSCEIFHASLKDDIKYEALSYCWGDPKLQDSILLNGIVASVTVNLTRALEDIRLDHGTRVLWVDALCINQEDTRERNHQVKQMGAIYQRAERVVVWLGRPKSLKGANTASVLDSLEKSFDLGLEYSAFQPNLKANWLELTALCELPYWHRQWIVQEIGLAAELHVYHGRSYKDWKVFSKIRKEVERAKKIITLHESLQGIARTITESVPGMLDQQREYRQPLWLGEMHTAMQHLFSRAEGAARAAKILWEVLNFSRKRSAAPIVPPTISKEANTPTKQSRITKISFETLQDWTYVLGQDPSSFSREVLASIANGDFESNESTHEEGIVTIPCFLPLDAVFGKACNNLPKHIEYVRAHERQGYHEELKHYYDAVLRLKCYKRFSRLARVMTPFHSDSQRFFQILSGELKSAKRDWKFRLGEFRFKKMDLSTIAQGQPAYFDESEKALEMEVELQLEEIKVMDRGLKYLQARYQEVIDYFGAYQKFDTALRNFSQNLDSDARSQQPAFVLRTLLETCERSLCQDPRDKVYGLLGLASNVKDDDLPVDYSKSMFELFWDVVWFTYKQLREDTSRTLSESGSEPIQLSLLHQARGELIRFSQLMQRSLGGPFSVDITFQGYMSPIEPPSLPLVLLYGFITGTVLVLDFGGSEPGAALYQNEAETLKQYFRGQAGQSSTVDMVAAALEQLQDANRDRLRPFTTNYSYGTTDFQYSHHPQQRNTRPKRPVSPSPTAQPVLFVEDSGLIGLASRNVRSDDLLVQFQNCDIAAIIRQCGDNEAEFRLVSRAVVARKFDEKRKTVSESSAELFKYAVPDNSTVNMKQRIWFWLDAVTLQELTCPVSERREYNFDTLAV
jgi:hypothetical protein